MPTFPKLLECWEDLKTPSFTLRITSKQMICSTYNLCDNVNRLIDLKVRILCQSVSTSISLNIVARSLNVERATAEVEPSVQYAV